MEVAEVLELPNKADSIEIQNQSMETSPRAENASKKRNRPDESESGFGESTEVDFDSTLKVAKYAEGETPGGEGRVTKETILEETVIAPPKPSLLSSSIFQIGDDDDYDNAVDRERRRSYLTSMGKKKKKEGSLDEKLSFSAAPTQKSASHSAQRSASSHGEFKSPSKSHPRTTMEKKEFVKDSVQNKLLRDAAPQIRAPPSKALDLNALMQKITERRTQIKLPTAEQVGLAVLDDEEDHAQYHSGDESSDEEVDEISIEIEEEEPKTDTNSSLPPSHSATMPPPQSTVSIRTRNANLDEDEVEALKEVTPVVALPKLPAQLLASDDDELLLLEEEEDIVVSAVPEAAKEMDTSPGTLPLPSGASQTLPTEPTLPLESPQVTVTPSAPLVTPGGVKLKGPETAAKPSLLSTWLSGQSTTPSGGAKKTNAAANKQGRAAKSTSSIPSTSPSSKARSGPSNALSSNKTRVKALASDTSVVSGIMFDDENAMTGEVGFGAHVDDSEDKGREKVIISKKAKQLFDDEAENGLGSDGEEVAAHERVAASSDEEEGGSSQDEYENEVPGEGEEDGQVQAGRLNSDIFETDDRAVIRSLQMKQEMEREAAEARAVEEMALRRERRDRRIALDLQAEVKMLQEQRKLEDRLAVRRAQRSSKKSGEGGRGLESSASLPVLPSRASGGVSDWLLDDSDESADEGDDASAGTPSETSKQKRKEMEKRRLEVLADRHSRRKLASSSQFLMQDEDSQSILQVIEKANTQHSWVSSNHSGPDLDSPHRSLSTFGEALQSSRDEASQDSLGGWFDRPGLAASSFSASSVQHLTKLKATFKGHATQLHSSALLFQRSQDGFENSNDAFDASGPSSSTSSLKRSKSSITGPKTK